MKQKTTTPQTTQTTQTPQTPQKQTQPSRGNQHFKDDNMSLSNKLASNLESASDTFQYFLLSAGAIETYIIMTYLGLPPYLALLFPFGIEGAGLNAKLKLQNGKYVTEEQQKIGKYILNSSISMSALAILMIVSWAHLPELVRILGGGIFAMSPFALNILANKAKNLDPSYQSIIKRQAAKYEVEAIELENKRSLAVIQTNTHYGNLIAEEKQRATIAQTDNNIVNNALAMKLVESEIQLAQNERMKADALKLIESKGKKGLVLKEKSINAMMETSESYINSDEGKKEMAQMARLFFKATIDDVAQTLIPAHVEIDTHPNTTHPAINAPSANTQVPALINNRVSKPARKCNNPACNKPLSASAHKSKKYCDNSCKTQASKVRNTT